ncbi:zinc-ribbon domain-containing protein [Streptomyces sp. NPDC005438]|uniref:zinc-ribbon domain-containing protein n=1 Tax=Streptomyces sp. NPDC005438 TaxID=3156880 RepID=UPI0033A34CDC
MIIFGTSSKVIQLAMLSLLCGFCGNPSAHALRRRVTKFTLFFIPLFPIAPSKHSLQCTFCGGHSDITKEQAEQLLAQGAPQQPGMGAQMGQPGPQYGQQQPYGQQPGGQGNPFAQPTYPQQPPHQN